MNQIDKAKELLNKIKLDQLEEEKKILTKQSLKN